MGEDQGGEAYPHHTAQAPLKLERIFAAAALVAMAHERVYLVADCDGGGTHLASCEQAQRKASAH